MVALSLEMEEVLQQVKSWPAESRIALIRGVLETLSPGSQTPSAGLRGPSAKLVLGLWNVGDTAPTDAECEQILVKELSRKYAS